MRWPLVALVIVLTATFPQLALYLMSEPLVWAFGGGLALGGRRARHGRWTR
ncbi:hypothetical protein AB0L04_22520 [Streptomyces glaucescens]|uniref:hypothetical protein n=1 Tax=Streptomyces glaucescens TaxID=1907 RepID=UPI00344E8D04